MQTLKVSLAKFREMGEALQGFSIAEKNKITATVFFQQKEYIMTTGYGDGKGIGWKRLEGYEIIRLRQYKGDLKPLFYGAHFTEVDKGNRERSYTGLLLFWKQQEVVCLQKMAFIPCKDLPQMQLFESEEAVKNE